MVEKLYTLTLNADEWHALRCMYDKSFDSSDPENALETSVGIKVGATSDRAQSSGTGALKLSQGELWVLMCNYDASYDANDPENALEARVGEKISAVHKRAREGNTR